MSSKSFQNASKLNGIVSVLQFGAVGDGVADDTAAIQAAINSFSSAGGVLSLPTGNYKISSTLSVTKPVMLVGTGSADIENTLPVVESIPAVKLIWAGSAAPMINYGGFGNMFSGGGIQYIALDGSSIATQCLVTKDLTRAKFTQIVLSNAVTDAWLMTNTAGLFPTSFFYCDDIRIMLRNGSTQNANGITIKGTTTANDGVTLCVMNRVRIDHADGHGILIGTNNASIQDAGDNFIWNGLYTYRSNSESGYGVCFNQINANSLCDNHSFYHPVVSGGFYFREAGVNYGTSILQANETDLNSNLTSFLQGAGVIDVACEMQGSAYFGKKVIPNLHSSEVQDTMCFVRYDSANSIVQTLNGNWSAISANGASYADGAGLGSSIIATTGTTSGNQAGLYGPPSFNGVAAVCTPMFTCLHYFIQTANIKVRMGFFDSVSATINNGVYVEYDSSITPYWRLVCRSGGVETVQTLSIGPFSNIFEWQIRYDLNVASFNYRADGFIGVVKGGAITTNIPTGLLGYGVVSKTLTNASAVFAVESIKVGWVDEGYPVNPR